MRNMFNVIFENNDGSGSLVHPTRDDRNFITLFMQKQSDGKKHPVEFINPRTKQLDFSNNGAGIGVAIDKKRLLLSWNDKISCETTGDKVSCSVTGTTKPSIPIVEKSAVERSRTSSAAKKVLKREGDTLHEFDTSHLDLWNEAKTSIRDINGIVLAGVAGAFWAATTGFAFLPVLGLMTLAAPLAIGVPVLSNGESINRNHNGKWFLSNDIDDEDKWISKIDIDPSNIDNVTIKQDDEFYFHANVKLKHQSHCKIDEESDVFSIYPDRRLTCT